MPFVPDSPPTPARHTVVPLSRIAPARVPLWTVLLFAVGCGGGASPLPELPVVPSGDRAELLARGEYLVRSVAVCGHCHAADPRDPDGPLSGGHTFRNWRFGAVGASNLTSDAGTGIGAWSEAELVRAIRTGTDRAGRLLIPVMPYGWYHGMSDADALAVALYLKGQPPVRNPVERRTNLVFRVSRALFLSPERAGRTPAPAPGETAEYGRYLALHVAHCAGCHTPAAGLRGEPDRRYLLAGDPSPPGSFPAPPPNLTPEATPGLVTGRRRTSLPPCGPASRLLAKPSTPSCRGPSTRA